MEDAGKESIVQEKGCLKKDVLYRLFLNSEGEAASP